MVLQELKRVKRILPASRPHWVGNGFNVFPVFANLAFTGELSPWLMFDYAAPKEFKPTNERLGVGQHPHRGFETVTIAFQGSVEHRDSVGNTGVIGPGDVQWMTAGRGIIHEEYHSTAFAKSGGTFEMCQLWVNLPAKDKMHAPRYQPILDQEIPVVSLRAAEKTNAAENAAAAGDKAAATGEECADGELGTARIIAGELDGVVGPAMTFSPVELFDISLSAVDTPVAITLPEGHSSVLFVRKGEVEVNEQVVGPQAVALLEMAGTRLQLTARQSGTQVLLLGA